MDLHLPNRLGTCSQANRLSWAVARRRVHHSLQEVEMEGNAGGGELALTRRRFLKISGAAALDVIWLPAFAAALHPVNELFTPAVKADLFPSLVSGGQIGGKYLGMPVWTNSEIIFYRKDLFGSAKEKKAFQKKYGYPLAPP